MTQEAVQKWVDDFMTATSGGGDPKCPTDWKKIQELMSKRCTVEMPGEPKYKKFEDWQKKASIYYNSFKAAKRTIPAGCLPIVMIGKKDDAEVIVPEETKFEWNSGSTLAFGNVALTTTTKAKVVLFHRFTISSKGECSWYSPLFAIPDFRKDELSYEDDAKEITKLYADWTEQHPLFAAEEIAVQWPVVGKMDKAGLFALLKHFGHCKRTVMEGCSPISMAFLPDKDGKVIHDCIVPVIYTFKWASALNEMFKIDIADGAAVELRSYDCMKVDRTGIVAADFGKVISFAPHFDPAVHIKVL